MVSLLSLSYYYVFIVCGFTVALIHINSRQFQVFSFRKELPPLYNIPMINIEELYMYWFYHTMLCFAGLT